jgi:hypothetical protein
MSVLLGFAPLTIFALLAGLSVDLALWAALAVAFVVSLRDFAHTRMLRTLDVASVALFGVLAIYSGFIQPGLSSQAVRLMVDATLLVLAVRSIVQGTPFTADYAREDVPEELWNSPAFRRANYLLAILWIVALSIMGAADGIGTFDHKFPVTLGVALDLAALTLAVVITARYPLPAAVGSPARG